MVQARRTARLTCSRRSRGRPIRHRPLLMEQLETRTTPSTLGLGHALQPAAQVIKPYGFGAAPFYPADISGAYAFPLINFKNPATGKIVHGDGLGQTVAIVDAGDSPTIANDLATFDSKFNLPPPPNFIKVNWAGQTSPLPPPVEDWPLEINLDVEWVHALAPKANIVLFEAAAPTTGGTDDLGTAAQSAGNPATYGPLGVPVAGVISNSYGGSEFSGETSLDSVYTTSDNHATFTASTGDSGAPGGWPAYSPNVLAVGGTTLYTKLRTNNTTAYVNEIGWSSSGGGVSIYESKPSYQSALSYAGRSIPDVAMDADPNSGVYVVLGNQGFQVGGTSLSAPLWAALLADLNEGRALNGEGTLGNAQADVYQLPATDFHDIRKGSNGFSAGGGYDLVTGIGSPRANLVVRDLLFASSGPGPFLVIQPPPSSPHPMAHFLVVQQAPSANGSALAVSSFPADARPSPILSPMSVTIASPKAGTPAALVIQNGTSTPTVSSPAYLISRESREAVTLIEVATPKPPSGPPLMSDAAAALEDPAPTRISEDFFEIQDDGSVASTEDAVPNAMPDSFFAEPANLMAMIGMAIVAGIPWNGISLAKIRLPRRMK